MAAGRPYIVGEQGPELVLPSQGGYVLNADDTQQALADARGAFSDNRKALNSISSTSREQRTEKWLSSGATSTEIKYSRVGSGDLPFVTEEDMLQATRIAAQEGARMGQQRTMAALKNNPGARRTIGI
jgi:phage-related minor tail protein